MSHFTDKKMRFEMMSFGKMGYIWIAFLGLFGLVPIVTGSILYASSSPIRNRVGVLIIVDCALVHDQFQSNQSLAAEAIRGNFERTNQLFLDIEFAYIDADEIEQRYRGYGFTLVQIDLCRPEFDSWLDNRTLQLEPLKAPLLSDKFFHERVNFGLVMFVTAKPIVDQFGHQYNGFSLGPICSETNVVAVQVDGLNTISRSMVHQLAHSIGAEHDEEGDGVMRQWDKLKSMPTTVIFSNRNKMLIARFIHHFGSVCFISPVHLNTVEINTHTLSKRIQKSADTSNIFTKIVAFFKRLFS